MVLVLDREWRRIKTGESRSEQILPGYPESGPPICAGQ